MKEIWKAVKDYEGIYEISNIGRIRGLDRFIVYKDGRLFKKRQEYLSPTISTKGYYYVNLSHQGKVKSFRIHQLVISHFVSKPFNKPQTNHKDGNKLNNKAQNLEWVTNSENQIHAVKLGIRNTKLSVNKAKFIRENTMLTRKELANIFNVDITLIGLVLRNKIWNH